MGIGIGTQSTRVGSNPVDRAGPRRGPIWRVAEEMGSSMKSLECQKIDQ
jgi:hypothetical protein